MASDEEAGLSEETISVIEGQVKKGKARRFFMITKGAAIKTVVVFKKGQCGPKVMEAKKSGFKGEVTYGVVSGTGKNLVFQFAGTPEVAEAMKVDAFTESVPVKEVKLKEFFSENGLEIKPDLQCVTVVADALVPTADDDEGNTAAPSASAAGQPSEPSTIQPQGDEQQAASVNAVSLFTSRLKSLKPDMDRVIQAGVAVSGQLKELFAQVAGLARDKQFESALSGLDQVEQLVAQGLQQLASPTSQPNAETNQPSPPGVAEKLGQALEKMTPLIKVAIGNYPARREELLKSAAAIKKLLADGQLDAAKSSILDYGAVLKSLQTAPESNAPDIPDAPTFEAVDPKKAEWKWRSEALAPQLKKVLSEKLAGFAQIAALFKQAQALQGSDLTQAIELLKQCSQQVEQALKPAEQPVPESDETPEVIWRERISFFPIDMKQLRESPVEALEKVDLKTIEEMHAQAQTFADAGEYERAHSLQDQVDVEMESARREVLREEMASSIMDGKVAFAKAQLRWSQALSDAIVELERLQDTMVNLGADATDLSTSENAELASSLDIALVDFQEQLDDVLREGMNAPDAETRAPLFQQALGIIDEFITNAKTNKLLELIDRCPEVKVNIRQTLSEALEEMKDQLTVAS